MVTGQRGLVDVEQRNLVDNASQQQQLALQVVGSSFLHGIMEEEREVSKQFAYSIQQNPFGRLAALGDSCGMWKDLQGV